MATQTQAKPLNKRETSNLIGSDKVEGTPVYRPNGDSIGQIERVMIDTVSGGVARAVVSSPICDAANECDKIWPHPSSPIQVNGFSMPRISTAQTR